MVASLSGATSFRLRASSYGGQIDRQVARQSYVPPPREPIVKIPSASIRAIAIRSLRTECRQMQNKDARQSSTALP